MQRKLLIVLFSMVSTLHAQMVCIHCFDTNDSISSGVHNLIRNGSFENFTVFGNSQHIFCPNAQNYGCDITDWVCRGGGSFTYACLVDSVLQVGQGKTVDGSYAAYMGNYICRACSATPNDTSCIVREGCEVNGIMPGYPVSPAAYGTDTGVILVQTVNGLIAGNAYVLEFWAGGEAAANYTYEGIFALDLGFGNVFLNCKPTDLNANDTGNVYLIEFYAVASSHKIKFTNWGHIGPSATELLLDNVRLYERKELNTEVASCISGLKNNDQHHCFISPNPVSDFVTIETENTFVNQTYFQLFDIRGRMILQKPLLDKTSRIGLDEADKGIYLYKVNMQNQTLDSGKLVVQ